MVGVSVKVRFSIRDKVWFRGKISIIKSIKSSPKFDIAISAEYRIAPRDIQQSKILTRRWILVTLMNPQCRAIEGH